MPNLWEYWPNTMDCFDHHLPFSCVSVERILLMTRKWDEINVQFPYYSSTPMLLFNWVFF